jgi:hypothetical protein
VIISLSLVECFGGYSNGYGADSAEGDAQRAEACNAAIFSGIRRV